VCDIATSTIITASQHQPGRDKEPEPHGRYIIFLFVHWEDSWEGRT
jgi:hypothetical protein